MFQEHPRHHSHHLPHHQQTHFKHHHFQKQEQRIHNRCGKDNSWSPLFEGGVRVSQKQKRSWRTRCRLCYRQKQQPWTRVQLTCCVAWIMIYDWVQYLVRCFCCFCCFFVFENLPVSTNDLFVFVCFCFCFFLLITHLFSIFSLVVVAGMKRGNAKYCIFLLLHHLQASLRATHGEARTFIKLERTRKK